MSYIKKDNKYEKTFIENTHMWLVGYSNPSKMEQSWEYTFLRLFTHINTKSASKKDFIIGPQNYLLACMANQALMGLIGHAC